MNGINFITYRSEDSAPNISWICRVSVEGQMLGNWFFGSSKEQVKAKAEAFLSSNSEACSDDREEEASGRGQHFVGKKWMFNRATGERVRINPEEVAAYTARGFVPGGPRSK